jgi:Glutamate-cysteine ligase
MIPHLKTALARPLLDLERRFLDRMPEIERWPRTQRLEREIPFYASVDLRNAGFKLGPIDTRGKDENLNAPGAQFVSLAFESPCIPDLTGPAGCPPNRFYAYGVVARLAQLAASIEIEALEENPAPVARAVAS